MFNALKYRCEEQTTTLQSSLLLKSHFPFSLFLAEEILLGFRALGKEERLGSIIPPSSVKTSQQVMSNAFHHGCEELTRAIKSLISGESKPQVVTVQLTKFVHLFQESFKYSVLFSKNVLPTSCYRQIRIWSTSQICRRLYTVDPGAG